MEVFCRNIPEQIKEKHLEKHFKPVLQRFNIHTFAIRKIGSKNAILTIVDVAKAKLLLEFHGQEDGPKRQKPKIQLYLFDKRPIYLTKGRNEPDEFLLRSLADEEGKAAHQVALHNEPTTAAQPTKSFLVVDMSCGIWDYLEDGTPLFINCYRRTMKGKIIFGKTSIRVHLIDTFNNEYELEFLYSNIYGALQLGGLDTPSVTVTGQYAPRLYVTHAEDKLAQQMQALLRGGKGRQLPVKRRVGCFDNDHGGIVATCFTYRFLLQDKHDILAIRKVRSATHMPDFSRWVDTQVRPREPYPALLKRCVKLIEGPKIPFRIKFQLEALLWNGDLSARRASRFYPHIHEILKKEPADAIALALQRLQLHLSYPIPDAHRDETEVPAILEILMELLESAKLELKVNNRLEAKDSNNISVHKVQVTPCGIYLSGPNRETKNRVLRKYADYIDYFLRVEFVDETGDRVHFDPNAQLDDIFHVRFKEVLQNGISIGGRTFRFLGFSHSSLRSQTCWFVAPFTTSSGEPFNAGSIIQELGYFANIRSPAKQAARIGQAFSDTLTSIPIRRECIEFDAPDVERNGRVFSDGVGTISPSIMYKIWNEYALREQVKPTVFQIRILGAKGMVSLDTRYKGDHVKLRQSMIKFPCHSGYNIEICGSGIRPLPSFLNNQLVKILEDLGVPSAAFLKLQADEINRLRSAIKSTEDAVAFVEGSHIAKSVHLPWMFRMLKGLKLAYFRDDFLRQVMELALLMKLRDLKYRARIPVPKAVTLYGIMDETGYLKEGEIFCCFLTPEGYREILVRKNVAITRAPALHPGDVQVVNAVDVPEDSPLRRLHNCIVFSQHGKRDLPSMLSGGDLDGDLYNVIYDDSLIPPELASSPADYPRVPAIDLGRPVQPDDITDFFVTFMQQDQLGRIAIAHQVFADQRKDGTFDPTCLLLAELHSTAVDFSKTGIPVDLNRIPRTPRNRPDFLAPGPRVRIAESLAVLEESDEKIINDDEDEDRPQMRYYPSEKTLGQLYRNINEGKFLDELRTTARTNASSGVLQGVWDYVASETQGFQWEHLIDSVKRIREMYEDNLRDIMQNFSATPWKESLTEFEVFIGNILGDGHKQARRDRESSQEMRSQYEKLVEFTVSMIREGEAGDDAALERSMACFWLALNTDGSERMNHRRMRSTSTSRGVSYHPRNPHGTDKLLSFPWIAAITCLREVDKFQRTSVFF